MGNAGCWPALAGAAVLVTLTMSACGGGGGQEAVTASTLPTTTASPPTTVSDAPAEPSSTEAATSAPPTESAATSVADGSGMHLVVIGDSLPFGGHFCGGCRDVGKLYGAMIEGATGQSVTVSNRSSDQGIDSKQLLELVRTNEAIRAALAEADFVVVSSGHNDTPFNVTDDPCDGELIEDNSNWAAFTPECSAAAAAQYRPELDGVLDEVATLRQGKPTAVRVLEFYNDLIGWPPAPAGSEEASINITNAFDDVICQSAEAHGALCIDVYHAFNGADGLQPAGALLEGDYTHPNQEGHQKMADLLFAAGLAPVA